jgi:hypothetical protein
MRRNFSAIAANQKRQTKQVITIKMSHFTVMVVTPTNSQQALEAVLQPYHEFECTGVVDQYIQSIDVTEERREEFESYGESQTFADYLTDECGYHHAVEDEQPDLFDKHKYGYFVLSQAGEVSQVIKRTNPNKKWDWWTISGRWKGFLLTQDGNRVDCCQKQNLDVDGLQFVAANKAAKQWDEFDALTAQFKSGFVLWPEYVKRVKSGEIDIDQAHTLYHEQDLCKAILGTDFAFHRPEGLLEEREKFIEAGKRSAYHTFAMLIGNQWRQKGDMGRWANVSNEKADWIDTFDQLFESIPDEHWITIVDCHI